MLRNFCESDVAAKREFGTLVSTRLKSRITDLCAADTIFDLPVGLSKPNPPPESEEEVVLHLSDHVALVFRANHRRPPMLTTGGIDWQRVNRIKIVHIGKYDGESASIPT